MVRPVGSCHGPGIWAIGHALIKAASGSALNDHWTKASPEHRRQRAAGSVAGEAVAASGHQPLRRSLAAVTGLQPIAAARTNRCGGRDGPQPDSRTAAIGVLFDHLVGGGEHGRVHR
jgi:hypothetical protein